MLPLSPLPRTLQAALRDVHHAKLSVRGSALRDLARLSLGDDRQVALAALAKALREDGEPSVRAGAAVALADAEAQECIEAITLATRDESDHVRQMALIALGEVARPGDEGARAAAERGLCDAAPAIRYQALIAIYRVCGEDAVAVVLERLSDADEQIRYVALRLLEEHWLEEPAAPRADRALEPAALERVRPALEDSSEAVRLAAAILLARAGDSAGQGALIAAVNSRRAAREPEDEHAAVELAGELKLEAARRGLERRAFSGLLSRDRFAWQARVALAKMGDKRAKRSILRDLKAWTRDTRTLAVAAAGRAQLVEARQLLRAMRGDEKIADPHAVDSALAELGET